MHKEIEQMKEEVASFLESIKVANPALVESIGTGVDVILESWLDNLKTKFKGWVKPKESNVIDMTAPEFNSSQTKTTPVFPGVDVDDEVKWDTDDSNIDKDSADRMIRFVKALIEHGKGGTLSYLFKGLEPLESKYNAFRDAKLNEIDRANNPKKSDKKHDWVKTAKDLSSDDKFIKGMIESHTKEFLNSLTEDDIETYVLPEYWAPALINEDFDGYTDEDMEQIHKFLREKGISFANFVGVGDDSFFKKSNDATDEGCQCLVYDVLKSASADRATSTLYKDQAAEPTSFVGMENANHPQHPWFEEGEASLDLDDVEAGEDGQSLEERKKMTETRKKLDQLERLISKASTEKGSEYRETRHKAHILLEELKNCDKSTKQEQRFDLLSHKLGDI